MVRKIRFAKILSVARRLGKADIDIYLADLGEQLLANVQGVDGRYYILVNFRLNKTEADIIEAISHELAHIQLKSNLHGGEFDKVWQEIRTMFLREIEKENKNRTQEV